MSNCKGPINKTWSPKEDTKLQEIYPYTSVKDISVVLGRSLDSIRQRASFLNLKKNRQYKTYSFDYLYNEYTVNKRRIADIAQDNNVSHNTIYYALLHNNIPIDRKIRTKGKHAANWHGYEEIGQTYWGAIQRCAKNRRINFDISIEYAWDLFLQQNRKCVFTKIELIFSARSSRYYRDMTASLDRKDSKQGYVEGNVQWVHKVLNHMKWSLNNEDFIKWCQLVVNNQEIII